MRIVQMQCKERHMETQIMLLCEANIMLFWRGSSPFVFFFTLMLSHYHKQTHWIVSCQYYVVASLQKVQLVSSHIQV